MSDDTYIGHVFGHGGNQSGIKWNAGNQWVKEAFDRMIAEGHGRFYSVERCTFCDYPLHNGRCRVSCIRTQATKARCDTKDNETTVAGGVPPSVPQADGCSDWREMDPRYPGI